MIIIDNLKLLFGARAIFDGISTNFDRSAKIGCVGRNGAGKSTMLKVIAGMQGYDSGQISVERGRKIAYLPQEVVLASEKTVLDEAYTAFAEMALLQAELVEIEHKLEDEAHHSDVDLLERYAHIQEKLAHYNPAEALTSTRKVLTGLGFSEERINQSVNELSVGWKMRLVLAKLLLQDADFYLFDEPTNHLDIVAKDWFAHFLRNSDRGYLLVSHDRYFLDHVCDETFEIELGKGTLYKGNYSKYLQEKEHALELLVRAHDEQLREIKRKKEWIDKFKAKANFSSRAQSMQRTLDRMELIQLPPAPPSIRLNFGHIQQPGKIVLTAEEVSYGYTDDSTLFENVKFEIPRGEKVALVAANGVGKTTLFNIIAQLYKPRTGTVEFGHNVSWTLFEQEQDRVLNKEATILDEVENSCTTSEARQKVRAFLGAFLFKKEDVEKKIGVLSGGEKNRVAMVKTLLTSANVLLLDEPTNHLDLDAKDILLKALQQFSGTIFFVSHDRIFLDELATMTIELTPKGTYSYAGNYSDYLDHKEQLGISDGMHSAGPVKPEKKQDKPKESGKKQVSKALSGKESYELRKKSNSVERKIEKAEKRIQEFYQNPIEGKTVESLQKELEQLNKEWEEIQKKLYGE